MWVESITLRDLPGVTHPVAVNVVAPGLVLLCGPNGSGKSSVGTALRCALWPDGVPQHLMAALTVRSAQGTAQARLAYGTARWTPEAPTLPQSLSLMGQLSLRDLLKKTEADDDIARSIQRELDGGYDLASLVGTRKRPASRPGRRLLDAAIEAKAELQRIQQAHAELARNEATLDGLTQQIAAAKSAPARAEQLRQQQRRRALAAELATVDQALDRLPDGLDRFPPDGVQRVRRLVQQRQQLTAKIAQLRVKRDEASATVASQSFGAKPPPLGALESLENRAVNLVRQSDGLASSARALAQAQAKVDALRKQVWRQQPSDDWPTQADVDAVATALRALGAAETALQAASPALAEAHPPREDVVVEALQAGRVHLREWFTTPRIEPAGTHTPLRLPVTVACLLLGFVLMGLGIALLFALDGPLPWVVVAVGAGVFGLGLGIVLGNALPSQAVASDAVLRIQQRYASGDIAPVAAWTHEAVGETLRSIEERLREHEAALRDRERAEGARRDVQALTERVHQARRTRDALFARLGLSADLTDLSADLLVKRWQSLGEAMTALADADAEHASATAQRDAKAAALSQELGIRDCQPEALHQRAKALIARWKTLERATLQLAEHDEALRELQTDIGQAHDDLGALLDDCGVDAPESPDLILRQQALSDYQRLSTRQRTLREQLAAVPPDPTVDGLDNDALSAAIDAQDDLVQTLEALQSQKTGIEAELERAIGGDASQVALRDVAAARDALVSDRDEALHDHAHRAVVTWLTAQRGADDAPALQRRASSWFSRFTQNRYRLEIRPGGFEARDLTSNLTYGVEALSDGTRIQLLLAARLASIEHAEGSGERVPLFIDEALSTADPVRGRQIMDAILELVRSGRQVFYATANPTEVALWEAAVSERGMPAPSVVHLGSADGQGWRDVPELPAPEPVPRPSGSAIEYVAQLGLKRPTLHDAPEAWPLPLLLQDDLDRAYEAACSGVRTVGQHTLIPDLSDALAPRATVLTQAIHHLRIGRGRPVTWADVEASGAVSPTFSERVQDVLTDWCNDPHRFVQEVANLQRFRSSSVEQLREHLMMTGQLDPEPPLDLETATQRTQVACANAHVPLSPADIRRWMHHFVDVLDLADR